MQPHVDVNADEPTARPEREKPENTRHPRWRAWAYPVFRAVLLIATGFLVGRITAPPKGIPNPQQPSERKDGPVTTLALEKSPGEAASGSATKGAALPSTQEGATISGIVVDEAGKPVARASISIAGPPPLPSADPETVPRAPAGELGTTAGPVPAIPVGQTAGAVLGPTLASSDAVGRFSLRGLPAGNLQVVATAAGFAPSAITVESAKEHAPVRITLRRAGVVEGTAQDDKGTALEAVLIIGRTEDGLTATAMSDAEGDFTLKDVRGKLEVQAFADAHVPASCEIEVAADQKLRCDFVLTKSVPQASDGGRIAGYVLDSLGLPVVGATVWTDENDATTVTDGRGEFTLVNVAPGALYVLAEEKSAGSAQSSVVRAREGETLNDVRVYLPRRFTGSTSAVPTPARQPPAKPSGQATTSAVGSQLALELRAGKVMIALLPAAAADSGLQVGDVLDAVDGERVLSLGQARGMLRDPPGAVAKIRVVRGRERTTVRYRRPKL